MKRRLVVVVQDGVVQTIVSETPDAFEDVEIIAINYDCDEAEEEGPRPVIQSDGSAAMAFVERCTVKRDFGPFGDF